MNHKRIYDNIINNAKLRHLYNPLDCYTETHHIIPKCMGGSDNRENLAVLTAREHFIAHALLCFIYPHEPKLLYAFNCMVSIVGKNRYTAKGYAVLRERYSKLVSSTMSLRHTNVPKSLEHRKKIGKANINRPMSDVNRSIVSISNSNRVWKEDSKHKLSESLKGKKRLNVKNNAEIVCKYCNKVVTKQTINMYHGPNSTRFDPDTSPCRIKSIELNSSW